MNQEKKSSCSFCKVKSTISNPIVGLSDKKIAICYNCTLDFYNIFQAQKLNEVFGIRHTNDNKKKEEKLENIKEIYPKEILNELDKNVIGQKKAKEILSIAVYNHYKRINNKDNTDLELDKSNIMMVGPSGSGKTLLVKTLAKILEIPMVTVDATSMTQSGYVGEDVEVMLSRLYQEANGNIKKAERGIIFIDEIDKIAKNRSGESITKDVGGEGVQQTLLKIIEGTKSSFPLEGTRKNPIVNNPIIDTSNILFIFGGAFSGIEDIISDRLKMKKNIGFNNNHDNNDFTQDITQEEIIKDLDNEDLIHYGFIPEFIGRIPVITYLQELTREELKEVITKPKNSILKQYKYLFSLENIELNIDEDYINKVVDLAVQKKVGARGIRNIIEKNIQKYILNIEDYKNKNINLNKHSL